MNESPSISLLPVDEVDPAVMSAIAGALERAFEMPVSIQTPSQVAQDTPGLLQDEKYNSTAMLLFFCKQRSCQAGACKLLAVTQQDLYSPIFSYLYGEAQLGGSCAVMSLHRLNPLFYREPRDQRLFIARCVKEALHELGHTFGLHHCHDNNCVMYPSSTIGDTDVKSDTFCNHCQIVLKNSTVQFK